MKNVENLGLYGGVPEGRNMLTIKCEEALYQNMKKSLVKIHAII